MRISAFRHGKRETGVVSIAWWNTYDRYWLESPAFELNVEDIARFYGLTGNYRCNGFYEAIRREFRDSWKIKELIGLSVNIIRFTFRVRTCLCPYSLWGCCNLNFGSYWCWHFCLRAPRDDFGVADCEVNLVAGLWMLENEAVMIE